MKKFIIMVGMMVAIITGCTKPVEKPVKEINEIHYHEDAMNKAIEEAKATPGTFGWTEPVVYLEPLYTTYHGRCEYVERCKTLECYQHFNDGTTLHMRYVISVEKDGSYDIYFGEVQDFMF